MNAIPRWAGPNTDGNRLTEKGTVSAPVTSHELPTNLIEIEGEIYLWQKQMTREIRLNQPGSKAGNRPDSKVSGRAESKCNPVNHPLNARAGCRPVGKRGEAE
jgi:hypothetical protein